MDKIIDLSICIVVFNQLDIVKWNISNILKSSLDNIEIVIQDDCSTEDILNMVSDFKDKRIKYYRNEQNLGHDSNIIEGFKHCNSDFIFLLRSSDTLITERIEKIIEFAKKYPNIGYCRFSCVDDDNIPRIILNSRTEKKGTDSVNLQRELLGLLSHPSGELYNKKYLTSNDYNIINRYLDLYFDDKKRFIADKLIRHKLIITAGVAISNEIVWKYTYTDKRKDVAQNKSNGNIGIYHPIYQYKRLECELSYVLNELHGEGTKELVREIIDRYAFLTIFAFKDVNKNKQLQEHYSYQKVKFSSFSELKHFKEKVSAFAMNYSSDETIYIIEHLKQINACTLFRWEIRRICSKISNICKKILFISKKVVKKTVCGNTTEA